MSHPHVWRPQTDIYATEDTYVVLVEIAGMRGADFSVTFDRRHLVIKGMRSDTSKRKAYHQMEIAYGEFETEVTIPSAIDVASIEATYNDGFLRVVLPISRPQNIKIE